MLPLLLLGAALASEWGGEGIRPRLLTDISAHTIPRGMFRLGPFSQQYGLLDNTQISTSLLLFPYNIPNISAKITAIEEKSISASIQSGVYYYNLEKQSNIPDGRVTLVPVGFTTTWVAYEQLSFHAGMTWQLFRVKGDFTPTQIGKGLEKLIGVDIGDQLETALGDEGGIAVGANVSLTQFRLGLDYRKNKRDAWIVYGQASLVLNALIAGGIQKVEENGEEKTIGASAAIRDPLDDVPAALVIARQWSWKHYSLRVGLPLSSPFSGQTFLLALPYAMNMNWQF